MSNLELFHFEEGKKSFEDFGFENGTKWWHARELMSMLDYDNYTTFRNAINKAMSACASLNIPIDENFIAVKRLIEGNEVSDYKLSRFACYLTAMNGDVRKPEVARAQAYFVTMAEAFRNYIRQIDNIDRILIRDEITDKEKSLSSVVNKSGIQNYGFFQNAGYRGLYNMNMSEIKKYKGIKQSDKLLDFMGKTELAANLFRITQTEDKIKNESIYGQKNLENAAETVGKEVRKTIEKIQGTKPEYLPPEEDIKEVKKAIKGAHKEFKKIDSKKK